MLSDPPNAPLGAWYLARPYKYIENLYGLRCQTSKYGAIHGFVSLPVSLVRSCEFRGESSSSDHLSASSPTANIVSRSSDRLSSTGFGGTDANFPLAAPLRVDGSSGDRPSSSSSRDPPKEAISKPSSS